MEKYKICPTCGTKNLPTIIECIKCETDLTGVPIGEVIIENEDQSTVQPSTNISDAVKMVRVCECGVRNKASARKCSGCGEDISDIIPTQDSDMAEEQVRHFILSAIGGGFTYEFVSNLTVVGRENEMEEYLSTKPFVSRMHAEFLQEADKLWVKNHSKTNYTYLNNEKIKDNEFTELHDGDIIGLGGKEINGEYQEDAAFFIVRIKSCT